MFLRCHFWNSSNAGLNNDSPFSLFKEDHHALLLFMSLSSRQLMVWCVLKCLKLLNSSNAGLNNDSPFSLFKEDHHALLLFMSLSSRQPMVWYVLKCLKLLNSSDLLRCEPFVMAALHASLSARSFPFRTHWLCIAFDVSCCTECHVALHVMLHFVQWSQTKALLAEC